MKFLCLCRYDIAGFSNLTPADFQEIAEICAPHDKRLRESGQVEVIGSLAMPHEMKTLRQAPEGDIVVEDGPYQSVGDPVGAFFMVEAGSIEEATEIAKLHPGTHLGHKFGGGIEVVPVGDFWTPGQ